MAPRRREEEAGRLLNRALDLGVTFLDTAAIYGLGAERAADPAPRHAPQGRIHARLQMRAGRARRQAACSTAARRDHRDARPRAGSGSAPTISTSIISTAPTGTCRSRTRSARSQRAVEAGKIGAIGLCEMGAGLIRRAHAVHPIAAVQSEYSPMVRNPEVAVLDTCRELGIGFVAFSPVARGMLATRRARRPVREVRHPPHHAALHRRESGAQSGGGGEVRGAGAGGRDAPRRSSRSPGCWRRATTSSRSPARAASRIWRRMSRRRRSAVAPDVLDGSRERSSPARSAARAMPPSRRRRSIPNCCPTRSCA